MSPIPRSLLKWYDANARALPWRVEPAARKTGERPDPYRVWLSEIMLQQTTVRAVAPRFEEFISRWPTVEALAAASLDDVLGEWAGLGYYARARNLHKCAVEAARAGGFPESEEELRALPGIGQYTAAAIAAIAFDAPAIVVDGNIERVAARLFAIEAPLPKAKAQLRAAIGAVWPNRRSGDFAQALMDLGASVCSPRNPKCLSCPLSAHCEARAKGIAETLPRKAKKAQKPMRRGVAYALVNANGEMLFERRPERGLLGGMLGLPGTEWVEFPSPACGRGVRGEGKSNSDACHDAPSPPAPLPQAGEGGGWRLAGTVTHTFTHFHLELDVMTAMVSSSSPDFLILPPPRRSGALARREGGRSDAKHRVSKVRRSMEDQNGSGDDGDENYWLWLLPEKARLPTVMKKALERAVSSLTHSRDSGNPLGVRAGSRLPIPRSRRKAASRGAPG